MSSNEKKRDWQNCACGCGEHVFGEPGRVRSDCAERLRDDDEKKAREGRK